MHVELLSNSPESLLPKIVSGQIPLRRVWWMLALRSVLTFGLLVFLAAIYKLAGNQSAIAASSAWWLWFITVTNIVCIILLFHFGRREGVRLRDIYFVNRSTWKGDLLWFLIAIAGIAVFALLPGTVLARLLWNDPNYPNSMLFQPLPILAIYPLFLLMPTTQALAELPIYWGYVSPRLRAAGMNRWLVMGIVGLVLSLQHMFFSFQLDWRYDLWLAFKFLPFALWTGFIVYRRPTSLPYLMFVHFLMDASLPLLAFMAAKGLPLS